MSRRYLSSSGFFLASGLTVLNFSGCGLLDLVPQPGNLNNRVLYGYQAIVPIPPADTAKSFLDSGTVSFDFHKANTLEYDAVNEGSLGGLGPNYHDFTLTLDTKPVGDTAIQVSSKGWDEHTVLISPPPLFYRKDSTALKPDPTAYHPRMDFTYVSQIYPDSPLVNYGVFITDEGNKMLVLANYSTWPIRIYLEPYGLIYCVNDYSKAMSSDLTQFWIKRINGVTVDRKKVFGQAKGLLEAYAWKNQLTVR